MPGGLTAASAGRRRAPGAGRTTGDRPRRAGRTRLGWGGAAPRGIWPRRGRPRPAAAPRRRRGRCHPGPAIGGWSGRSLERCAGSLRAHAGSEARRRGAAGRRGGGGARATRTEAPAEVNLCASLPMVVVLPPPAGRVCSRGCEATARRGPCALRVRERRCGGRAVDSHDEDDPGLLREVELPTASSLENIDDRLLQPAERRRDRFKRGSGRPSPSPCTSHPRKLGAAAPPRTHPPRMSSPVLSSPLLTRARMMSTIFRLVRGPKSEVTFHKRNECG